MNINLKAAVWTVIFLITLTIWGWLIWTFPFVVGIVGLTGFIIFIIWAIFSAIKNLLK